MVLGNGHTYLNGTISATSVETGKVLDIELMSKSCFVCHKNPNSQHECTKKHEGIRGGIEGDGVFNIFNFSLHTQGICYTKYLGYGYSKA
jgi:hypothetical protein